MDVMLHAFLENSQQHCHDAAWQDAFLGRSLRRVPGQCLQEGFETTVGTNYFGHFLLTHLLLDKLKQTGPGARSETLIPKTS
jgi:NAD(P)-dependent dehydrogenase (short-subunit alcohol dehydrogenase family)